MLKNDLFLRKSRFVKGIILATISIIIIILTVLLITFALFFILKLQKEEDSLGLPSSNYYQYLRHNPITNETSVGFVTLVDDLKDDDFLSYKDEDGSYNLISNIGSREYICTGSCYCEQERRNAITISRSLVYLVAAISGYVAIKETQEELDEECRKVWEDVKEKRICYPSEIYSNVDECNEIKAPEGKKKYFCKGSCLENLALYDHEVGEEHYYKMNTVFYTYECGKMMLDSYVVGVDEEDAKATFIKDFMNGFCELSSREMTEFWEDDLISYYEEEHEKTACVGNVEGANSHVHCKEFIDGQEPLTRILRLGNNNVE